MAKQNLVLEKSFHFSLQIINLYKEMTKHHGYILSKQLLRSGTSIGANIEEANAGFSKRDFAAKMSMASKEARETKYWLRLIQASNLVDVALNDQLTEIDELILILTASVKTSQQNVVTK